jgi:2-oxoisovalerate dehydrogenase E2 component (dihydrolipoyl transacylase)
MSLHVIKVPDIGEGVAEVELVAWHVKPGDAVSEDQVMADVMTDKATVEVPSSVAGTVLALGGEVGQVLAVGAELIRIDTAAAGRVAAPPPAPPAVPVPAAAAPALVPAPAPVPLATSATAPTAPAPAASRAASAVPAPAAADASAQRPIASPSVRARAWELGIDLAQVRATGTAGRIMQADLDAHLASGAHAPASAPTRADAGAAAPAATQTIKVIGLRRKIAQKMQESKRRIPHYAYVEEVDVTEVEALREHLNAKWAGQRARLTPLAFLMRAMVLAADEVPDVNALFDDDAGIVTRHGAVHIGVAAQTDMGLLVPVLRDAQSRDLWSLAEEAARIAALARSGKASRNELSGSTITITSLGKLGGVVTTPVINHPEVAIVGVGRIIERPVVRRGAIVVRQVMNLSSSFDHRVVDGAVGAAFVQRMKELLEHPATLFIG